MGPKSNGILPPIEKETLLAIGAWIKTNKNFIYDVVPADVTATNATVVKDDKHYYAIIRDVAMQANANVAMNVEAKIVIINTTRKVKNAKYLDNNRKIKVKDNQFEISPFDYGISMYARVVQFDLE